MKARLHWFWRVTIALIAGLLAVPVATLPLVRMRYPILYLAVGLPLLCAWWLTVATTVALGVNWLLARHMSSDRLSAGEPRCTQCGYNVTGNTSGRCPECGGTMWSKLP
jgi:hypothetical protein